MISSAHVLFRCYILKSQKPFCLQHKLSYHSVSSRIRNRHRIRIPSRSAHLGIIQAKRHLRRIHRRIRVCAGCALLKPILLPIQRTRALLRITRKTRRNRLCWRSTTRRRASKRAKSRRNTSKRSCDAVENVAELGDEVAVGGLQDGACDAVASSPAKGAWAAKVREAVAAGE
jgi:hypothetical protein